MMCAVRFSPDGTRLAAGGADNVIRFYDVSTGKQQLRIEQHADWVTDLAFSPDGSKLASASRDKSCRVFNAQTGAMESAYLDSEEAVYAIAWGGDGKRIYSAGRDRKIRLWNAADAKPMGQITGLNADVFRLDCSGGLLLACTGDGVVNAYAEKTRKLVRTFPGITDWIYSLAIDAKNRRVAAGCFGGEVRVWNLDDANAIARFIAAPRYEHRKN
jgi:WD40 repeat protein